MRFSKPWLYSVLAIATLTGAIAFNAAICTVGGLAVTIVGIAAAGFVAGVLTTLAHPPQLLATLSRILKTLDELKSVLLEEQFNHAPMPPQSLPNDIDLSGFVPIASFYPSERSTRFIVVIRDGDRPNQFVQALEGDGQVVLTEHPEAATIYHSPSAGMATAWYAYLVLGGQKKVDILPASLAATRES